MSETQRKAFAAGYQDALRDVQTVWAEDGPEAAAKYITDNLAPVAEAASEQTRNEWLSLAAGGRATVG